MLTKAQQEARTTGIGSSDAAAILGLDRYRTAYDVWLDKTGRDPGGDAGEKAELGNALERGILKYVGRRLNQTVRAPRSTLVRGLLRANIDGMIGEAKRGAPVVEIKTTGLVADWGADGTGDVPDRVLVQVHHQLYCAESDRAVVACLRAVRGLELTLHPIRRDETLVGQIVEACERFWKDHVLADVPPAGTASLETLARRRRDGRVVELPIDLVEQERAAKAVLAAAEKTYDRAKAELLAALGDSENGVVADWVVSYRAIESTRIDAERLRREFPEVAAKVANTTKSRRLEIRNVGGGGVVR